MQPSKETKKGISNGPKKKGKGVASAHEGSVAPKHEQRVAPKRGAST